MNFGTLILIFIIISFVSNLFDNKKKPVQTQKRRQQASQKQNSIEDDKASTRKKMTPIEMELISRQEGKLSEDKSKTGSMTYVEVDAPDEGIQTESVVVDKVEKAEEKSSIADYSHNFGLSEMQYNIVMSEVVGLPRALKRNIR